MGITKSDLFTEKQNEMATLAKTLAHPARIAILEILMQSDTCINGDLVQELGLAQATISQHLRELKHVGLIQGSIDGVRMNYCIHPGQWKKISLLFADFFDQIHQAPVNKCCSPNH